MLFSDKIRLTNKELFPPNMQQYQTSLYHSRKSHLYNAQTKEKPVESGDYWIDFGTVYICSSLGTFLSLIPISIQPIGPQLWDTIYYINFSLLHIPLGFRRNLHFKSWLALLNGKCLDFVQTIFAFPEKWTFIGENSFDSGIPNNKWNN